MSSKKKNYTKSKYLKINIDEKEGKEEYLRNSTQIIHKSKANTKFSTKNSIFKKYWKNKKTKINESKCEIQKFNSSNKLSIEISGIVNNQNESKKSKKKKSQRASDNKISKKRNRLASMSKSMDPIF